MPLSFSTFVKQVLYCLNRDSHSSADEFRRRYFSEYHLRKHVSYLSLTSLHSGASDADISADLDVAKGREVRETGMS